MFSRFAALIWYDFFVYDWISQFFVGSVHQMAEAPATLEDIAEFSDPEEENEGDSVGTFETSKAQFYHFETTTLKHQNSQQLTGFATEFKFL